MDASAEQISSERDVSSRLPADQTVILIKTIDRT